MEFMDQVKEQLKKMNDTQKDTWILNQAKLLSKNKQNDFLMSLCGEKKVIDLPSLQEIDEFVNKVIKGDIYIEYKTYYCEFDSEGHYMDDWVIEYHDVFDVMCFLDSIFKGCHHLVLLEEYQAVSNILNEIGYLRFCIQESIDSVDSLEEEFFTLVDADHEGMLSTNLSEVGEDWIKVVYHLSNNQSDKEQSLKLIEIFDHPFCQNIKPHILINENISQEVFVNMAKILEQKINDLELYIKKELSETNYSHKKYKMNKQIDRYKGMLQDIHLKCLKDIVGKNKINGNLASSWELIQENMRWLSYEPYIDDQVELEEIEDTCQSLIENGRLGDEDWDLRKKVLQNIVENDYYNYYCDDAMLGLAEHLCTNKEEYLFYASILETKPIYQRKAAYMYHKYGRDDKYIAYLENHLNYQSQAYSDLIIYYMENNLYEDAKRVADIGLEKCREDLTIIFICLLLDAQRKGDEKIYKKLYASAKRRKRVDMNKVNDALNAKKIK